MRQASLSLLIRSCSYQVRLDKRTIATVSHGMVEEIQALTST